MLQKYASCDDLSSLSKMGAGLKMFGEGQKVLILDRVVNFSRGEVR